MCRASPSWIRAPLCSRSIATRLSHFKHLIHLKIVGLCGTALLQELAQASLPRLQSLEIENADFCANQNQDVAAVLNTFLDRMRDLKCFRIECKRSVTQSLRLRVPLSLQWLSLSCASQHLDVDLSANRSLVGVHVRDSSLPSDWMR